ncbi:hypothetical protein RHMOL_Rhmol01G0020500 [Rhododendron molle]|uniref:Uncharacterized protein n=1 Tax=Rhododendron molle TaxID=49168 RepID=A0ACC0PX09_RHOML|nr:hypothetical protein RHMOL_Rhmol01G0020500 [Rhododendron molle]
MAANATTKMRIHFHRVLKFTLNLNHNGILIESNTHIKMKLKRCKRTYSSPLVLSLKPKVPFVEWEVCHCLICKDRI